MRRRRVIAVLPALAVIALAVTAAASARRGVTIRNGPIAFSSNRDGDNEIYAMRPDGTRLRQLTRNAANDYAPAYSPAGDTIALVSDRARTSRSSASLLTGPPRRT